MNNLVKKFFLSLGLVLLGLVLVPIMKEYMQTHQYYVSFLTAPDKWQHLVILLLWVVCALWSVLYLTKSKKPSFWWFIILLWLGLRIFSTAYIGIRSEIIGGAPMKMLINSWFLFGLWVFFIVQLIALGTRINEYFLKFSFSTAIIQFLLSLALWLIGFLSLFYIFLLFNIAFPLMSRLIWGAGAYLVWKYWDQLGELWKSLIQELFPHHTQGILGHSILYLFSAVILALFTWVLFARGQSELWWYFFACLSNRIRSFVDLWKSWSHAQMVEVLVVWFHWDDVQILRIFVASIICLVCV
jgi:hypothetical protein